MSTNVKNIIYNIIMLIVYLIIIFMFLGVLREFSHIVNFKINMVGRIRLFIEPLLRGFNVIEYKKFDKEYNVV